MTMLPQPPPNVPAPPPSEAALRSRSYRDWIWIVGIPSVVGCFVLLTQSMTICGPKKASHSQAVSNARQMGLALSDFQKEYGTMPDVSTIAKVRASKGSKFNLGTKSSNDFFRQLIASGVVNSEMMFYAQVSDVHQPDNVFSGASALAKGECAFAYILGALKDCNPSRPIVMAPMIPGTDRFDPKPFDGKAVILKADNSVMFYPISIKTGHIMERGQNLMDPTNPIWEGKPPSIVWPEL